MTVQRTIIILFLLCIQFYISDQSNSVQQPADILGDDSPENKRHNEIDLVKIINIYDFI